MTLLEDRLRDLGDALDLANGTLVDDVLGRLDGAEPINRRGAVLRVAAVAVLVLAAAVALIPSSRRAVADWLGFDGVSIERRPLDDVPTTADPVERDGAGTVVAVDGADVLVSEFVGRLDNPGLTKTVGTGSDVQQVVVGGELGLWIDGEPHEVSFLDAEGDIVFEGFAGNTLLWQDGDVVRRVEGFDDVTDAITYAESIGT